MIKFFRRIRQNLLIENKTGKYFKYAIGEIILVVIGILITLQINNWNQDNQKVEQEIVYYFKIKEDLQNDQRNIQRGIKYLNERIFSAKALLINLHKQIDDKSIIMNDYIPSIRSYSFIPSKEAIEDIIGIGTILWKCKLESR